MSPLSLNLPVGAFERDLVQGLAGDSAILRRLLGGAHHSSILKHRLGPALVLRAKAKGLPEGGQEPWRDLLRVTAGRKMLLEHHLAMIAEVLAQAGVPWLPLKGFDLGSRAYEFPEERPAGDIDILVPPETLGEIRRRLQEAGWVGRAAGERFERFLRDEAYCWQARHRDGAELEVHFRLWGAVPRGYPAAIFEEASPDPTLGATAWRSRPADAYLLAAVHAWMDAPPRPLLAWWDLERICGLEDPEKLSRTVAALAGGWGLQLPVLLSAAHAASLWPNSLHGRIAGALAPQLRIWERMLLFRAQRFGTESVALGAMTLARLVSLRPSRSGWKALGRWAWAHPGVVERETPASWPWVARRTLHLARRRGWNRAATWLESRFGGV